MSNLAYLRSKNYRFAIPEDHSMISYLEFLLSIDPSQKTLSHLKHKLKIMPKREAGANKAKLLLAIGNYYLLNGDFNHSMDYCLRSLSGFKKCEDLNGLIIAIINLSQIYNFISEFAQVGRLNMQLNEMMYQTEDPMAKAFIRLNLAEHAILNMTEHAIIVGKMADMETDIKEILNICSQYKCWYLYSIANILLGYLNLEKGDASSAIAYLSTAREFIEHYNLPPIFTYYTYHMLPEAYWLDYKIRANRLTPENRAALIDKIKQLCDIAISKTRSCLCHHGSSMRVQAKCLILEGCIDEAESFFKKSIQYCLEFGRRFELGITYYNYAYLLNLSGRQKELRIQLNKARDVFKEIGATAYLNRITKILGDQKEDDAFEVIGDQIKTLTAIINISRHLSSIKELDVLAAKVLQHALELTDAACGCLFIKNEKEEFELKAVVNLTRAAAQRKIVMSRLNSTFDRPMELYIPIKIGKKEVGFCYLEKKEPSREFNGHDVGSLYLFVSQVSVFIENCRLIKILGQKKDTRQGVISSTTEKKLEKAVAFIRKNYSSNISRSELAQTLNMNADNLGRFFKKYTGYKLGEYINRLRMEDAARMLKESDAKVIEIAFSVGFDSLTTFNRVFHNVLKTTPSKYRKSDNVLQPEKQLWSDAAA